MPTRNEVADTVASLESLDFRVRYLIVHPQDWEEVLPTVEMAFDRLSSNLAGHNTMGIHIGNLWGIDVLTSIDIQRGTVVLLPGMLDMGVTYGRSFEESSFMQGVLGTYREEPLVVEESPHEEGIEDPPEPVEEMTLWEHLDEDF
jgi:hypothetical protein